jgi:hypothetical protein
MSAFKPEQAVMVDVTNAQAWASDVADSINREGPPCPISVRASQNVATITLWDKLHTPSTDRVDKVYCQLKDIHSITDAQQVESSL